MRRTAIAAVVLLCTWSALRAQGKENDEETPWSTNEATLVGAGGYNVKDTYLSPLKYTGWGFCIVNERMKMVSWFDHRVSRQQFLNIALSSTDNPAENATDFTGFIDYTLGYHYRLAPLPGLKVLLGPSVRGDLGFIYNTRNGNNPATAKAGINFNLSAIAVYTLRIRNYPLTVRYQFDTPFAGALFAPHYGQSYYEIFDLGNHKGVVAFASFHNQLAFRHYLTVDLPIANFTLRTGFLNQSYRTRIHHIRSHVVSRSFMIGLVKEFVSFGGKRLKQTGRYASAFY